jgi:Flp pilus assembly protein TadD
MGVALRELGRLGDATDAHMRAVSLLHQDAEAHLQLGITLAKAGQADWAIRALETALRLDPHQPRAHAVLAEIYHWLKPDAQRSMWHEGRATEPGAPPPSDNEA